jgi:hypothetical protein
MLSFQIIDSGKAVRKGIQINCDAAGISVLMGALAKLVGERASHLHLCGPSAGGSDLVETTPWGKEAVYEVIITYVEGD